MIKEAYTRKGSLDQRKCSANGEEGGTPHWETTCTKVDHVARGAWQVCQTEEALRRGLGKRNADGRVRISKAIQAM